jgi:hypothetical protein
VRFERAGRRSPDPNREAHRSVVRVEHEFGHKRSNQARTQATEPSPRGLDRPGDPRVGAPNEEPREPTAATDSGSKRQQRHRAQGGRCRDLRDSYGDEQPPIRRRQPAGPPARASTWRNHATTITYNRAHAGLTRSPACGSRSDSFFLRCRQYLAGRYDVARRRRSCRVPCRVQPKSDRNRMRRAGGWLKSARIR